MTRPMKRIAIVTGASSGLGAELVRLIDAGQAGPVSEIWAVARREERLAALVRTCATPVRPFALDLTRPESWDVIEKALEETRAAEGDVVVSLLVNNAGAGSFGDFACQGREQAGTMATLLMRAPLELTYRVLPFMAEGSRILNVASVAAFLPQPRLAVYSAAKRFVLDFSRALDAELGPVGIHVTALCPKFMRTEFLDAPGDAEAARRMCAIGFENAHEVAAKALRACRAGKSLCIPSADMRAYYALMHVMPYRAALAVERALGIL